MKTISSLRKELKFPIHMVNVNEVKTTFSNPKDDIPLFYEDITIDSVIAKSMYDQIIITQTMYHCSATAMTINFKLALRGRTIYWFNCIKDTENVHVTLWSRTKPHFKSLL
jgi:hypothetical protein